MIEYDEETMDAVEIPQHIKELAQREIEYLMNTRGLRKFTMKPILIGQRNCKNLLVSMVFSELQEKESRGKEYVIDSYGNEVHVGDEVSFYFKPVGGYTRGTVTHLIKKDEAVIVSTNGTPGYICGGKYGIKDFRLVDKEDSYNEMGSNQ